MLGFSQMWLHNIYELNTAHKIGIPTQLFLKDISCQNANFLSTPTDTACIGVLGIYDICYFTFRDIGVLAMLPDYGRCTK